MFNKWANHPMNSRGRDNLKETDKFWEEVYSKNKNLRFPEGKLLYRVHTGGYKKPVIDDYDDRGDSKQRCFDDNYQFWLSCQNIQCIRFDNHWVSFTKEIDVIGSNYFYGKVLRGFVIVIRSTKSVDISSYIKKSIDEHEVVAPMDSNSKVEILPLYKFFLKYGKGTSDYEKKIYESL
ncbi:hypothetical protein E3427_002689 [Enterococcus faecium]|nr:hypothetical protein [Enterococcus faecium]